MSLANYSGLSTAIATWGTRSYSQDQIDDFILLAESVMNRRLGAHYTRETSTTLSLTSGSVALPTGFVRALSLVHTTYGPLDEASIAAVRERRVWDTAGIPSIFAVTGTTLETASVYTGNLTLDYEAKMTALSSGNTTNWLLTAAPDAYLFYCRAAQAAFEEEFEQAAIFEAKGAAAVEELTQQSTVAKISKAVVHLPGVTP